MTSIQLAMVLAAVLFFWMVGAHNRLVRLRNAISSAWTAFDAQLQRRAVALPAMLVPLEAAMPTERPALESVRLAQMQVSQAAETLQRAPVSADGSATLQVALAHLDSALARMLALLDQHAELRVLDEVATAQQEMHDVDLRLAFARQLFNAASESYNHALDQFPTRLLAGFFRFLPAGRL
jgi:LemA protein